MSISSKWVDKENKTSWCTNEKDRPHKAKSTAVRFSLISFSNPIF